MPEYPLNRGINKPVEFNGLVGNNIYFLVAGIVLVFALFVGLYLSGVPVFLTVVFALGAGAAMWMLVFRINKKYGEHGLMKASARRSAPRYITNRQSRLFVNLNESQQAGRS